MKNNQYDLSAVDLQSLVNIATKNLGSSESEFKEAVVLEIIERLVSEGSTLFPTTINTICEELTPELLRFAKHQEIIRQLWSDPTYRRLAWLAEIDQANKFCCIPLR